MRIMEDIIFKINIKTCKKYKYKSGFNNSYYKWFDVEKLIFSLGVYDSYGIEIIFIYKK